MRYKFTLRMNEELFNDSSAKIVILNTETRDTIFELNTVFLKKHPKEDFEISVQNITVVTIGNDTQHYLIDVELLNSVVNNIELYPLKELNYSVGQTKEVSIKEMFNKSGITIDELKNHLIQEKHQLKGSGSHEYIMGSIQCWIATRINGVSASMVCDFALASMVMKINSIAKLYLNSKIEEQSNMDGYKIIDYIKSMSESMFYGIMTKNGIEPISMKKLVASAKEFKDNNEK